ncbi:hypothetical protein E4T44_13563 [Aureobasidium sp. EXF-8845]|nr:hypothetical protein E4T44_13563 [Aureobasidium sp. EXF-8845]KAI4789185.1 hypothetical protein E4T45_13440 [Aureobasidium sp. EXF-8846]
MQNEPSSTPDMEAAELIEAVTSISEGLSDLPQDVLEFFKAIDDRLHQQEALLASLLAASGTALPSTTLEIANTTSTSIPVPSSTSIELFSSATVEAPSSLLAATACRRGGAGPLVLCSSSLTQVLSSSLPVTLSTSRPHVTRALTRLTTGSGTANYEPSSASTIPVLPVPSIYSTPDTDSLSINATAATTSTALQVSASYTSIPSPTSTNYVFKTSRQNNVAAYYGQTPDTRSGDLL